jgi:AbrB family transcriptional regulator, transcriptional pleiotropic regulator of transition state genes
MESVGIVRRLDAAGRVTLPRELRRVFNIKYNDSFAFYIEHDRIILQKYQPLFCTFCGNTKSISQFKGENICRQCVKELRG